MLIIVWRVEDDLRVGLSADVTWWDRLSHCQRSEEKQEQARRQEKESEENEKSFSFYTRKNIFPPFLF